MTCLFPTASRVLSKAVFTGVGKARLINVVNFGNERERRNFLFGRLLAAKCGGCLTGMRAENQEDKKTIGKLGKTAVLALSLSFTECGRGLKKGGGVAN